MHIIMIYRFHFFFFGGEGRFRPFLIQNFSHILNVKKNRFFLARFLLNRCMEFSGTLQTLRTQFVNVHITRKSYSIYFFYLFIFIPALSNESSGIKMARNVLWKKVCIFYRFRATNLLRIFNYISCHSNDIIRIGRHCFS